MKKILLATTALGMFFGTQAFAEGPTVTIGGNADFQVGYGDQKQEYRDIDSVYSKDVHTRNQNQINFKVDGKADNGLGYGALLELDASAYGQDSYAAGDSTVKRSYIYVDSGFGRVELGATGDAADALRVDASTFARATGGIGGDWFRYVDLGQNPGATTPNQVPPLSTVTTTTPLSYALPGLPSAVSPAGILTGTEKSIANSNKVSYYSPRIEGIQAGVSFTPDQDERGGRNGFSTDSSAVTTYTQFKNVWDLGLNYNQEFSGVKVDASATGNFGSAKDEFDGATARDDLKAYALGLSASYAGATIGGSWADISELGGVSSFNSSAKYWTLGAAYVTGPVGVSVGYLDSTVEHDTAADATDKDLTNLSFSADYKLAPGLVPYAEVSLFEQDDNTDSTVDNKGTVFLVGTELSF